MSNKKNHNTIHFLTTLSVYLGLIVVGASPQVLAQAKLTQNSQSNSFEVSRKTNNVFSELKFNTQFKFEDVLPFVFFGNSKFDKSIWHLRANFQDSTNPHSEIFAENEQVLTVSCLPRASI